jgi:hypothetical protein
LYFNERPLRSSTLLRKARLIASRVEIINLWRLNFIGGQHGHRDITNALLLPSIHGEESDAANWPPPVPRTQSVIMHAVIALTYAYIPPNTDPSHDTDNYSTLISCTVEVLTLFFLLSFLVKGFNTKKKKK